MKVVIGEAVARLKLSQWQCPTQLYGPVRVKLTAPQRQCPDRLIKVRRLRQVQGLEEASFQFFQIGIDQNDLPICVRQLIAMPG